MSDEVYKTHYHMITLTKKQDRAYYEATRELQDLYNYNKERDKKIRELHVMRVVKLEEGLQRLLVAKSKKK